MSSAARRLEEARHHILFHHNPQNSDGFITLCKKGDNNRFRQYHYRPEELAEHLSEWMGEDIYFSQQTFYKPQRSIENIRQLKSLYVDLDFYIFNYDPTWIVGKLEAEYFKESIPDPNLIIFSGRGIVLIWLLDPVPYKALPLWQAVQNYLLNQLEALGGDSRAVDAARVFRLAGTVNSKSDTDVYVDYRHNYRYTLRDIQFDYLPELKPYIENKAPKKRGRKKKVVHLYNIYSLHHNRLLDIAKLVELRNGDVEGHRELLCFLYRYWSCCFTNSPSEALEQTINFNNSFIDPLPKKEVVSATKSAEKAWEAKNNAEADRIAKEKGYPGAGYNITNAKLIKWLDISPQEQEQMLTIISTAEKNKRRRIKYQEQEGKMSRAEYMKSHTQKSKDKLEILKEHLKTDPTLSNKKLAKLMGVSNTYIAKLKKKL